MEKTFEEWCTEQFLNSVEPIDTSSYELPSLDIAKKFARELSNGSNGFNFFVFKLVDTDYYTIDFILGEEVDSIDCRDIADMGYEWEELERVFRLVKGDFIQIK